MVKTGFAYHMLCSFAHQFILHQKELVLLGLSFLFIQLQHSLTFRVVRFLKGEITQHGNQWED